MVNTLLFVGIGVNVKMFLAFLLSGFFMQPELVDQGAAGDLHAALGAAGAARVPVVPLDAGHGNGGLLDSLLAALFGIDGPIWFMISHWLAMGANIVAYIWKWMPFWTLIFLAGRMAIPQDIYEAAAIDGATGIRRLIYVTFPLLANLYLVCTLLSTLWTLGDFTTVYFVSSGAPALPTDVLATLRLPLRLRLRLPGARRGGDDVGAAGADPDRDPADAPAPGDGGAAMSIALTAAIGAPADATGCGGLVDRSGRRGARRRAC